MGKRDIPAPKRPEEFTSLEIELIEAIENIRTRNRAVEDMLASYAKAADPADETADELSVDEASAQAPEQNENLQPADG